MVEKRRLKEELAVLMSAGQSALQGGTINSEIAIDLGVSRAWPDHIVRPHIRKEGVQTSDTLHARTTLDTIGGDPDSERGLKSGR